MQEYRLDPQTLQAVGAYIDAVYEEFLISPSCAMECVLESCSLDDALETLDESFSQMVLRKIDEKGMADPECYKKAYLDRKLFSKLRTDPNYRPSKQTALAIALALELPLKEVREMLEKAGYALSHSCKGDVIAEYFIMQGNYDIMEINAALYYYDQPLLGARQ